MNLLSSILSRLIGIDTSEKRPDASVLMADMRAQGERADAQKDEYTRLRGIEGAFFPSPSNAARENGYAE